MTYERQNITTYPSADTPRFKTWAANADPTLLAAFPDAATKTPLQVATDWDQFRSNAPGLISRNLTSNATATITEEIWVDHDAYKLISEAPITGNVPILYPNGEPKLNSLGQPTYYTARNYLWKLYSDEYAVTNVTTIK